MPSYLEIFYPIEEYSPDKYPQKLCNYIARRYFSGIQGKLLDIGSGKGNHLVGFRRCGFEVYGLDKRKEGLEVLSNFDIRKCDLERDQFPFKDNYFDFVFSKSVLEHVYNTENIVKETYRVLKPGGISVQLTPDWATDYKVFWDDPTHVKPFTRKGLIGAFMLESFIDVQCQGFYQLPFLWKYPQLSFFRGIVALVPDSLKFKGKEKRVQNVLVRHSKERILLLSARKPRET